MADHSSGSVVQAIGGGIDHAGLGGGQALKDAEVALAKSRRREYGDVARLHGNAGGAPGPRQVAAINGGEGMLSEGVGKRARLRLPHGVQVDVDLSLDPLFRIPVRLTVPNQAEPCTHAPDFKASRASLRSMRVRFWRT
jgi:hypothetical protein